MSKRKKSVRRAGVKRAKSAKPKSRSAKKAKGHIPIKILQNRYQRLGRILLVRTGGLPMSSRK